LDDHPDVRLILKPDVGLNDSAAALDVNIVKAVNHNVADGRIFQQRFQRAESKHLVENFLDDLLAFDHGHRQRFVQNQPFYDGCNLTSHRLFVQPFELIRGQRVQEFGMNLRLDFEPAIRGGAGTSEWTGTHADFAASFFLPVALST